MKASDLPHLAEDLPTDAEDVAALRRAQEASRLTGADLIALHEQLGPESQQRLRARPVLDGEPFEL